MRLLLVGIAALALAAPVAASTRYLHVGPTTADPGDYVKVSGGGCGAHALVYLISPPFSGGAFVPHSVATHASASGAFSRFVLIRRSAHAGRYAVTARCNGGNLGVEAHLRVR